MRAVDGCQGAADTAGSALRVGETPVTTADGNYLPGLIPSLGDRQQDSFLLRVMGETAREGSDVLRWEGVGRLHP